jgi:hypothetical protein
LLSLWLFLLFWCYGLTNLIIKDTWHEKQFFLFEYLLMHTFLYDGLIFFLYKLYIRSCLILMLKIMNLTLSNLYLNRLWINIQKISFNWLFILVIDNLQRLIIRSLFFFYVYLLHKRLGHSDYRAVLISIKLSIVVVFCRFNVVEFIGLFLKIEYVQRISVSMVLQFLKLLKITIYAIKKIITSPHLV